MEEQWERPIADRAGGWTLHGGAGAEKRGGYEAAKRSVDAQFTF